MDTITLAIALSQIQKAKRELKKEDFKVSIEQDRSILNKVGQEKMFYFLPKEDSTDSDFYDEYLYVNNRWDKVGSTKIDLNNYYQKNEIIELLNTKENVITENELRTTIEKLYPNATEEEINDIMTSLLENYSTTLEAMINFIIEH